MPLFIFYCAKCEQDYTRIAKIGDSVKCRVCGEYMERKTEPLPVAYRMDKTIHGYD